MKVERREVPADLIEATPSAWGYWLLASPLLIFLAWAWVDAFAFWSPLSWYPVNAVIALALLAVLVVLPAGWLAHRAVTALPGLFQKAGWDVQPLEPVSERDAYLVRYAVKHRHRAPNTWPRQWLRAAQGWVYIEIVTILLGGILMIPLFFRALDMGFGR